MKKILSLVLAFLLVFSLAACGAADTESKVDGNANSSTAAPEEPKVKVNVFAISGPTGVGMVSLMDKADKDKTDLDYNFTLAGSNDEIVAKIANKEADIAAVATNLASTLYNKTNGGVTVLAVNTLGVLSVITKGEEVKKVEDLKGKTIYSTGQGANPEYIIRFILEKNGLKVGEEEEDVKLKFVTQPTELIAQIKLSDKAIVVAPQPVATNILINNKDAKLAIDINKEWDKVSDTGLVMGCVIARNEFIEQNPEAVKTFLKDYKASIKAVNKDVDTAASLCDKYGIITPAANAKKAIPNCNIVYMDGAELKTNLSAYLKFLHTRSPKSVGGALPADNFYYEAK